MKDHDGYEKGLLRSAMEGWLPPEVLWRKKSPYPKTHNPSYRAAVSEMLDSDSQVPWYGQLMTAPQTMAYMIQLNYWLKKWQVEIL